MNVANGTTTKGSIMDKQEKKVCIVKNERAWYTLAFIFVVLKLFEVAGWDLAAVLILTWQVVCAIALVAFFLAVCFFGFLVIEHKLRRVKFSRMSKKHKKGADNG